MTAAGAAGVVVDTMVISWLFDDRPNSVADHYRTLIDDTPVLLASKRSWNFVTERCAPGGESCVAVGWNDVSLNSPLSNPTTR